MASFVVQAILRVKDESSRPIKKIDRELKALFRTARQGRDIKISVTGLTQAERQVQNLSRALRALPSRRSVAVRL